MLDKAWRDRYIVVVAGIAIWHLLFEHELLSLSRISGMIFMMGLVDFFAPLVQVIICNIRKREYHHGKASTD